MATWRKLLSAEMGDRGEVIPDLIANTMTQDQMDVEFDDGYGTVEGIPFTAWSENFVYFPVCYDGAESVASAPRHPNGIATNHVGGK